jgi:hypothetical protein
MDSRAGAAPWLQRDPVLQQSPRRPIFLFMSHDHETKYTKKKLHQDWRFIVAVVLMLIAIVAYVMTLDDRMVPGPAPASPADTVPANP